MINISYVSAVEVKVPSDSGVFSKCVSLAWLEKQGLTQDIQPVNGEYIQLGRTKKQLPVLGVNARIIGHREFYTKEGYDG